jgi:transcription factor C subunit 3
VTINEIATFVASFYQAVKDDQVSTSSHAETSNPAPVPAVTVDRPLLAKVWTWLGRHPDVSIGDDRKYNKATLAQVESEFPGCFNLPTSKAILPDGNDPDSRKLPKAPSTPNTPPKGRAAESPRFRVNEKRFYQAICGHPPDTSKVAPLEFDLLSHIAVTRSEGILQGELVRLSGQDKRSVPRRTDGLHAKGYIIKEFVYRKGVRTSRLVLTKFAPSSVEDEDGLHEYGGRIRHGSSVRDAVRRIFDILADQALIPQASLAKELSLGRPAESAVLSKIIRRLDRLRCVKRVRTAVGPSATSGDLKRFVQLLHPPDAKDLDRFDTDGLSLDQSIEELASLSEAEFQSDLAEEAEEVDDHVEEGSTGHHLASWTPDRPITNVVRDAAQLVGRAGLTNWVRNPFYPDSTQC